MTAANAIASPSPLRGGARGGGLYLEKARLARTDDCRRSRLADPHPQPIPSRERGA